VKTKGGSPTAYMPGGALIDALRESVKDGLGWQRHSVEGTGRRWRILETAVQASIGADVQIEEGQLT
jgi:hypothetical protein